MADSVRVCDCFLDVAIYCLFEDLPYVNFFWYCLHEKDDRRNTLLVTKDDWNNCFIACCVDFIKNQDYSGINGMALRTLCFYFDSDDHESVCCADAVFFFSH